MKKILSFFLAIVLFAMPVCADDFDLSQMTLEELTELQRMVTLEIANRTREASPFRDDEIGAGTYTIGVDIKPGVYELVCVLTDDDWTGAGYKLFRGEIDGEEVTESETIIHTGYKYKLTLDDGNILTISDGVFLIQPYSHSWAPDE